MKVKGLEKWGDSVVEDKLSNGNTLYYVEREGMFFEVGIFLGRENKTEEHLSPNCNGSSVLEIGYYRDNNDSLHLSTLEFGEKKTDFKQTLEEVENLLDGLLSHNNEEDWKKLNRR